MESKTVMQISGTIFAIIAVLHLLRAILGWEANIAGLSIPTWASWIALIVSGYLAYLNFTSE